MIFFGGAFGLLLLALWIYCIFDVISTDEVLIQNLPKMVWLILVIILPSIGSIVWLVIGRPYGQGFRPGGAAPPRRPMSTHEHRAIGPEDSPRYIAEIESAQAKRLKKWEDDLAKREQELRRQQETGNDQNDQ
ncbi:MAG: PLD nuclease N-terminal domain-containing protein [Actinomycetota bacterium]